MNKLYIYNLMKINYKSFQILSLLDEPFGFGQKVFPKKSIKKMKNRNKIVNTVKILVTLLAARCFPVFAKELKPN